MGLSSLSVRILGQKTGEVRKGYHAALMMGGAVSVLVSIIVLLFGTSLISFFNSDTSVVVIGTNYLLIVGSFIYYSLLCT